MTLEEINRQLNDNWFNLPEEPLEPGIYLIFTHQDTESDDGSEFLNIKDIVEVGKDENSIILTVPNPYKDEEDPEDEEYLRYYLSKWDARGATVLEIKPKDMAKKVNIIGKKDAIITFQLEEHTYIAYSPSRGIIIAPEKDIISITMYRLGKSPITGAIGTIRIDCEGTKDNIAFTDIVRLQVPVGGDENEPINKDKF